MNIETRKLLVAMNEDIPGYTHLLSVLSEIKRLEFVTAPTIGALYSLLDSSESFRIILADPFIDIDDEENIFDLNKKLLGVFSRTAAYQKHNPQTKVWAISDRFTPQGILDIFLSQNPMIGYVEDAFLMEPTDLNRLSSTLRRQ